MSQRIKPRRIRFQGRVVVSLHPYSIEAAPEVAREFGLTLGGKVLYGRAKGRLIGVWISEQGAVEMGFVRYWRWGRVGRYLHRHGESLVREHPLVHLRPA